MVTAAVERAGARNRPARLDDVRLETLSEGRCVQTLHVGAFDDEGTTSSRTCTTSSSPPTGCA